MSFLDIITVTLALEGLLGLYGVVRGELVTPVRSLRLR